MYRIIKYAFPALAGPVLAALMLSYTARIAAEDSRDGNAARSAPTGERVAGSHSHAGVQGLRVYRDPQTGRLGPPPAGMQLPALTAGEQRMLDRSDSGLQARQLPGGGVAVNLQGRFRSMAVATVDAGGQPAVNCAQTPAQATAVMQQRE